MPPDALEIKREFEEMLPHIDDEDIRKGLAALLPLFDEIDQQIKTLTSKRDRLQRKLNRFNPLGDVTSWKGDSAE